MLSIAIVLVLKLPIGAISCCCNALSMLTFDHFHAENYKHLPLPHAGRNFLPACVEKLLKLNVDVTVPLNPSAEFFLRFTSTETLDAWMLFT